MPDKSVSTCMSGYVCTKLFCTRELYFFFFLQNYTVEVLYSPLFIVPLTETLFLTPAFRNMFPFTEAHIPQIRELQLSQHKVCG